jgi:ribosomal protein S27AE
MKNLKRMRYDTMNSWNQSTAPAYNLKVHNVIDRELQDKVFELMDCEGFYDEINGMIADFDRGNDYSWQAGFNGRSGGYLVLYRGGRELSEHKSYCTSCGQRNFTSIKENNNKCGRCGKNSRVDHIFYDVYTKPGLNIEDNEVPGKMLRAFRKLAVDIVKSVEYMANNASIDNEEYTVTKRRKVINY